MQKEKGEYHRELIPVKKRRLRFRKRTLTHTINLALIGLGRERFTSTTVSITALDGVKDRLEAMVGAGFVFELRPNPNTLIYKIKPKVYKVDFVTQSSHAISISNQIVNLNKRIRIMKRYELLLVICFLV